jgi:hypothetical protein
MRHESIGEPLDRRAPERTTPRSRNGFLGTPGARGRLWLHGSDSLPDAGPEPRQHPEAEGCFFTRSPLAGARQSGQWHDEGNEKSEMNPEDKRS